jgi:transcription antitermination factor NusG
MNEFQILANGACTREFAAFPTEPLWFAVQTRPRHEKKVSAELKEKGFTSFLPLCSEMRQWSDRRQRVELPLFSQYVFVQLAPSPPAKVSVLRTRGVVHFVGSHGMGTPIPEEQILSIHSLLEHKVPFERCSFLKTGQRVRIRGGSLEGITGVLSGVHGDHTLIVSVEVIQRSVTLRISGYQVEPV